MKALIILAIILGIIGIIGSIVPALPGPPVTFCGLVVTYFCKTSDPLSLKVLLIWLAIVIVMTIADYILPGAMTKKFGGHKAASVGATVGLFAGMFFTPVGMIGGSLLGAFLAEFLFADHGIWSSFKASIGAFAGFMLTTGIKVLAAGGMFWCILDHTII